VAVLADEQRRRMYAFARRARRPVTREEAAAEAGISAKLAAFHLDKLVAAGLLHASYGTPGGARRVGRRPKVYQPAGTDIRVSIPERRPDVMAGILLDAVLAQQPGEDAREAALRAAREHGRAVGRPGRLGPERSLTAGEPLLTRHGFEPERHAPTCVRLLNCPFHQLAARSADLVCRLNHAFLAGMLDGLETAGVAAVLAPHPGRCCVELRAPGEAPGPAGGGTAGPGFDRDTLPG
jgi:predicted ArsR family transcriptional regulator